jgi:hypothetical protein
MFLYCLTLESKICEKTIFMDFKTKGSWTGISQSVKRIATGWKLRGWYPGGDEILRTRPERPWGPLSLLYKGYRFMPRGKADGAWR